ncbi:MAG: RluA family pseudouridine synthase [Candidatus Eisenbacteria bacterium]|nr:RluA family pseudouridine synthase [Candidatus Eisenbacteria bacterium]
MAYISKRLVLDSALPQRLDHVVQELTQLSRREIKGLLDHETVSLNGEACTQGQVRVAPGDTVEVTYDPHTRYHERPRSAERGANFRRVFEDEALIVVDKAAMVLTQPTERHESNTLVDLVGRYLARSGGRHRPLLVHRLDRETSGLLVLAKSPRAAEGLERQFRAHTAEREYLAILAGNMERGEGTIESMLATNLALTRFSTEDESLGERAVTHFKVRGRKHGATTVRVRLETGRRNQIRVHFAEAGHPVLGDRRYRPEIARHSLWSHARLALHAAVLGLAHPLTGQPLRWEAAAPAAFRPFL